MDKDSQREADNHRKVELMTEAIACIQSLPGHETEQCIKKYQDNFFSERLREEQERENKLEKLKNEPFKLSCKGGCGTTLDGTNVRSIHGKYFVSIDREFLDAVKLSSCLMPDNFERLDDAFKIGSVCCSKPLRDSEKPCRQHVGSVVKYRKHYFVCLNKKSFMLHRASGAKRLKTWSEVPILALNEITDIPRYLQKRDSKELSKDRDTSTFVQTENGISAAKRHDRGSTQVPNTEASTERTEHFSAGAESSLGQGSVRIGSPTAHRKAISELRNEALMNAAQTGNNPHNDSALYESEEYLRKLLTDAPDLDMASLNTFFSKPVSEGSVIGSLKISMDSSIS